jgi:predicted PurR-regulated permease PerM
MQSLFAAQPFLLDNIMAFAQAYIMAQLVNFFTSYPRLSYCLVAGSAFSAAAIVSNVLGYPYGFLRGSTQFERGVLRSSIDFNQSKL